MRKFGTLLTAAMVAAMLGGCATSGSVDEKIAAAQAQTDQKIESVAGQVENLQQKQQATDVRLEELSQSAREALQRAQEAGVLARGQVVFEQSFTEDRVKFRTDSYELDQKAQEALTEFANRAKALDTQYFIEIQGHTDDTGSSRYNDELGQRRAESVIKALVLLGARENQLEAVSFGEEKPVCTEPREDCWQRNRRAEIVPGAR